MPPRKKTAAKADTAANIGFEAKLWNAADKLRQSRTLATLRDTLPPIMLRGELQVMAVSRSADSLDMARSQQ